MSEKKSRFKIRHGETEIEYEGDSSEVSANYKEVLDWIKKTTPVKTSSKIDTKSQKQQNPTDSGKKECEKRERRKKSQIIEAIPLNLKKTDEHLSLRQFYKTKNVPNLMAMTTIFVYFLNKYLDIELMEAGHLITCCREVRVKIPKVIHQLFYDTKKNLGSVELVEGRKFVQLNTIGENLVEYDWEKKEPSE